MNIHFEWDENKNILNQKKHHISFEEAQTVFNDLFARLIPDPDQSEERFILIGMSNQYKLLVVCHCERGIDSIRIISARKAEKHEQKQYENYHA